MGTFLVVLVILIGLIYALSYLRKSKKKGGCANCSASNHCVKKQEGACDSKYHNHEK